MGSSILLFLIIGWAAAMAVSFAYVEARSICRKAAKKLDAGEEALLYDYAQYVPEVLQSLPPARRLDTFQRPPDGLKVGDLTNEEIGWLAIVGLLPWAQAQHGKRLEQARKLLEQAEVEEKQRMAEEYRAEAEKRRLEAERKRRRDDYQRKAEKEKALAEREQERERDQARQVWQEQYTDAAGEVHYDAMPPEARKELGFDTPECAPCHSLDEDVTGTRFWREEIAERAKERDAKIDGYIERVKAIMPDVEVKIEAKLTQREQDARRNRTTDALLITSEQYRQAKLVTLRQRIQDILKELTQAPRHADAEVLEAKLKAAIAAKKALRSLKKASEGHRSHTETAEIDDAVKRVHAMIRTIHGELHRLQATRYRHTYPVQYD